MNLKYYQGNNFGDLLNPIIFNYLFTKPLKNIFEADFHFIGTNLSEKLLHKYYPRIIYGSGTGGGFSWDTNQIDKWKFYCVRGPLTAKFFNLDPKLSVTDPAVFSPELFPASRKKLYKVSIIPHMNNHATYGWMPLFESRGIHYISPCQDPDKVIDEISSSELILSEAMHGAILADAYRVPWIPIKLSYNPMLLSQSNGHNPMDFKWSDWCLSMGLEYHPIRAFLLFKKQSNSLGRIINRAVAEVIVDQIIKKYKTTKPVLSLESAITTKKSQLRDIRDRIITDFS